MELQYMYTENYKISLEEMKINKWKDICIYELADITLLKWCYHSKLSMFSMHSPSKSQQPLLFSFAEIEKPILKFVWNCKGPQVAKTILKKDNIREPTLSSFESTYKATVIITV